MWNDRTSVWVAEVRCIEARSSGHICQELAPFSLARADAREWLPGFHRASPSTPLDVSSYVAGSIAGRPAAGPRVDSAPSAPMPAMSDEPRSPRAEPSEAT